MSFTVLYSLYSLCCFNQSERWLYRNFIIKTFGVLQDHWSKCYWLNKYLRSLGILKLNCKCPQQFTCLSWKNILLLVRLHVQIVIWYSIKLKTRTHGVALRAVAKLHLLSTPEFVARNISRNIAAVEFRPTSATLRATNFFVYLPSAAFRANLWHKLQCSANQILNLTTDLKVSRRTFQKSLVTRSKVARRMFYMKHCAPSIQALCFQWSHSNATKVNQTSKIRAILCEVLPAKISGVDTRLNLSIGRNIEHNIAPCNRALIFLSNHLNETKVDQTSKTRAV